MHGRTVHYSDFPTKTGGTGSLYDQIMCQIDGCVEREGDAICYDVVQNIANDEVCNILWRRTFLAVKEVENFRANKP